MALSPGETPDIFRLARGAPKTQSLLSASCLASSRKSPLFSRLLCQTAAARSKPKEWDWDTCAVVGRETRTRGLEVRSRARHEESIPSTFGTDERFALSSSRHTLPLGGDGVGRLNAGLGKRQLSKSSVGKQTAAMGSGSLKEHRAGGRDDGGGSSSWDDLLETPSSRYGSFPSAIVMRRRDSLTTSQASTSLSRYFHKAKSFSSLDMATMGSHGESAKGLEKSGRPKKKRKHSSHEREFDVGSATSIFRSVGGDGAPNSRSSSCEEEDGSALPWNTGRSSAPNAGESSDEDTAVTTFDELCKSFEKSIPISIK